MTSVRSMTRTTSHTTKRILMMALATLTAAAAGCATSTPQRVYIGTYTKGWACDKNDCTSKGIYRADFDPATGKLGAPALAAESVNPSYLAIHPTGKFLYAVNEVDDLKPGDKTGGVSAFAIEPSGDLRLLNQVSSHGADPCHISLTASGKEVLVANYSGGSVASYVVADDGQLKDGSNVKHSGKSVHANQEAPHAHFIIEAPKKPGTVYVADLGIDQLLVYKIDDLGKLTANDPAFAKVAPGGGPRHIAFHPSKHVVYTNNELSSAITVFANDPDKGALTELQTIKTTPADFSGSNDTAELQVSQDGRFVYVSNRGHNSIATFAVDADKGMLTLVDHTSTQGDWPRDFKLDPSGKFLLVAHQKSNDVVIFSIDSATGKLTSTGNKLGMSKPVNFAFMPAGK